MKERGGEEDLVDGPSEALLAGESNSE